MQACFRSRLRPHKPNTSLAKVHLSDTIRVAHDTPPARCTENAGVKNMLVVGP